jgi:hypothetical protein
MAPLSATSCSVSIAASGAYLRSPPATFPVLRDRGSPSTRALPGLDVGHRQNKNSRPRVCTGALALARAAGGRVGLCSRYARHLRVVSSPRAAAWGRPRRCTRHIFPTTLASRAAPAQDSPPRPSPFLSNMEQSPHSPSSMVLAYTLMTECTRCLSKHREAEHNLVTAVACMPSSSQTSQSVCMGDYRPVDERSARAETWLAAPHHAGHDMYRRLHVSRRAQTDIVVPSLLEGAIHAFMRGRTWPQELWMRRPREGTDGVPRLYARLLLPGQFASRPS